MDDGGRSAAPRTNWRGYAALIAACALLAAVACVRQNLLLALCAWDGFLCAVLLAIFLFSADAKESGKADAEKNPPKWRENDAPGEGEAPLGQEMREIRKRGELLAIPPFTSARDTGTDKGAG
jgi:hypothetical protein